LWNGYPQPESAPYSLAKAMSVELSKAYRKQRGFDSIVLVPGNLYGPYDNFSLTSSHVIPALIRRFTEARRESKPSVEAWGSGKPKRDFVYVGDACAAIIRATESYSGPEIINLSSGTRTTIRDLVETTARLCEYSGTIAWDASKPDGQMDKGFDVSRMREWLGFECTTPLEQGLRLTIEWFFRNESAARRE
jgi:GDP-L-fucose synthase